MKIGYGSGVWKQWYVHRVFANKWVACIGFIEWVACIATQMLT